METEELLEHVKRIRQRSDAGALAEAKELVRVYMGEKSSFFYQLNQLNIQSFHGYQQGLFTSTIDGLIAYLENNLFGGISIERKAQIDVVSDFLEQAQTLLNSSDVHAAAPIVIIGAALEEFLRNWIENDQIDLKSKKPSLDSYGRALREADIITKQDLKDITSWAGLRNYAAHGEWDQVADKERAFLMLESVNLFMRRYGKQE